MVPSTLFPRNKVLGERGREQAASESLDERDRGFLRVIGGVLMMAAKIFLRLRRIKFLAIIGLIHLKIILGDLQFGYWN